MRQRRTAVWKSIDQDTGDLCVTLRQVGCECGARLHAHLDLVFQHRMATENGVASPGRISFEISRSRQRRSSLLNSSCETYKIASTDPTPRGIPPSRMILPTAFANSPSPMQPRISRSTSASPCELLENPKTRTRSRWLAGDGADRNCATPGCGERAGDSCCPIELPSAPGFGGEAPHPIRT